MEKQTQVEQNKEAKNRPVVYMKKNVKLVVWTNDLGEGRSVKNYELKKTYKDKNDDWKETNQMGIRELETTQALINEYLNIEFPVRELEYKD